MQGISPGIVRGVTSPWMLVGGCRIARIMPIAVETAGLGALMCTIGKTQRPLAVQKEGLHYHTCWAVKDGPPENFCIYNFLRFKRMLFGTPPSSLDIVNKKNELPHRALPDSALPAEATILKAWKCFVQPKSSKWCWEWSPIIWPSGFTRTSDQLERWFLLITRSLQKKWFTAWD